MRLQLCLSQESCVDECVHGICSDRFEFELICDAVVEKAKEKRGSTTVRGKEKANRREANCMTK